MAAYIWRRRWGRWHGTIDELARVATRALDELRRWQEGEDPGTYISISEKGGPLAADLSFDEFRSIAPGVLPRIRAFTLVFGHRYGVPSVSIAAGPGPALELEIQANDRSRGEGLTAELSRMLGRRNAILPWWFTSWLAPGISGVLSVAAFFAIITVAGLATAGQLTRYGGFLLGLIASGCVVIAWLVFYLYPDLELLPQNQRTRAARFWGWLAAAVVAFGLSVAAPFVVGFLQQR